ncbi:MAG: hypothetical protein WC516_04735 [Patescibacteria group bacterium]|jgi:hypothetical protein
MKITKIVNREVEEIDDLICNLCGNTLKPDMNIDGMYNFCGLKEMEMNNNFCGLKEVKMNCGYGSYYDGKTFIFFSV